MIFYFPSYQTEAVKRSRRSESPSMKLRSCQEHICMQLVRINPSHMSCLMVVLKQNAQTNATKKFRSGKFTPRRTSRRGTVTELWSPPRGPSGVPSSLRPHCTPVPRCQGPAWRKIRNTFGSGAAPNQPPRRRTLAGPPFAQTQYPRFQTHIYYKVYFNKVSNSSEGCKD
jgi:hypothetical protein